MGDLVLVHDTPEILTAADKSLEVISYTFGDEESDQDDETKVVGRNARRGALIENQLRGGENRAETESKRRDHQKELMDALQQSGLEKYSNRAESETAARKAVFKKFECYRKDVPLPRVVANLQVTIVY